jgi:hypothetical protein
VPDGRAELFRDLGAFRACLERRATHSNTSWGWRSASSMYVFCSQVGRVG